MAYSKEVIEENLIRDYLQDVSRVKDAIPDG